MAMILLGLLLIYAGVKGRSIRELLVGNIAPSQKPQEGRR
jgi:hypothetical protein